MSRQKKCLLILAGVFAFFIVIGVIGSISSDGSPSSPRPTATPRPTPTPAPQITAKQLLAEREANATRFDAQYKGNWVVVVGTIDRIDDGNVYLVGDGFLSDVVLQGLSDAEQIPLNIGDRFAAQCRVGNYILGSIFMDDCST